MNEQEFIEATAKFIQNRAFDLIQTDPHQWSKRPCPTCQTVSKLIHRDFGCVLVAKQRKK